MGCNKRVMFATLLAGAAVLLGTDSSAVAGPATMTSVFRLTSIHMVTTKIGWGTAPGGIGRTSDGAATWKLVLPTKNGAFARGQDALAVQSSQSALVAEIKANGRRLTVNSTADGGRTWKGSTVAVPGSPPYAASIGSLTFSDALHGWLLLFGQAALGSVAHQILRTSDGGRTWMRVEYNLISDHSRDSLPRCNGAVSDLNFRDPVHGWSTGTCGAGTQFREVYRTNNGGRTWRQDPPPIPAGIHLTYFAPQHPVFTSAEGVLPVNVQVPWRFLLYVTHNGGATWKPSTLLTVFHGTMPPHSLVFALNARVVWVREGQVLHRTTDSGVHWTRIAQNPNLGWQTQLNFVNLNDGFDMLSPGRDFIKVTTDSGRTWHRVYTKQT